MRKVLNLKKTAKSGPDSLPHAQGIENLALDRVVRLVQGRSNVKRSFRIFQQYDFFSCLSLFGLFLWGPSLSLFQSNLSTSQKSKPQIRREENKFVRKQNSNLVLRQSDASGLARKQERQRRGHNGRRQLQDFDHFLLMKLFCRTELWTSPLTAFVKSIAQQQMVESQHCSQTQTVKSKNLAGTWI